MSLSNVICIGEALIDRLGPLGGDFGSEEQVIDCFGGAPANVACALSRLDVNVSFIGSLGTDQFGNDFKHLMTERCINLSGLQQDSLRPTRIVLVRRDAEGERFFGGFEGDNGSGFADQAISSETMINKWPLIADKAKWLVIGTIPLASKLSSEALKVCIDKALHSGINIALDLNWRPTFWRDNASLDLAPTAKELNSIKPILDKVTLLKLAKEEAQWFFNSTDPFEISSNLPQRPSVIVTDGSNPINWLLSKNIGKSEAFLSIPVVDTTGAGDAFTAGLIYKLLSLDLDKITKQIAEEIIQFASACGAYVCQKVGAIESQPYLHDIDQFLSLSNGGMS
tara:strand:- start:1156 stop:2172 length:1017 start_codon:yes stop_codon:yes gene_type:complete